MRSSFNGVIKEIPGIFVDNFAFPYLYKPRAYFLSHTHKDHTLGLQEIELLKYLEEYDVRIYMTELSSAFVTYKDHSLKKYIRILKLGSELVTLPAIGQHPETHVNVKVIPAGHSCGSVMFMFETPLKRILYTGDFRIDPNDLPKYRYFHDSKLNIISIDTLYIDTTFLSSEYENFPKRGETVEQALSEIAIWLERDGDNRVGLNTSASTGYEYVFNEIYDKLGEKIHVDNERWQFYRLIPHLVPAMTNQDSKIHLCHYTNKDNLHTKCLPNQNKSYNFLKLRFSAQLWRQFNIDDFGVNKVSNNQINVCFATHCSSTELKGFVNYLAPKCVVGFPNAYVTDGQNGGRKRKKLDVGKEKKVCSKEVKRIMQF